MVEAPERIWIWSDTIDEMGSSVNREEINGYVEYVRADLCAALEAKLAEVSKERDEALEELGKVIMACPVGERSMPISKTVASMRARLSALEATPAPQLAEAVKRKREEISQHIHIDMASSAMFVAAVQAEAIEGVAIPLIEELSRRPSTQWGEIVAALREKAKAIKEEAGVFDGEYCSSCGQGPDACAATGCAGPALEATPPAPMVTEAKVEAALKAFHSAGRYASEKARMKAALTAAQETEKP